MSTAFNKQLKYKTEVRAQSIIEITWESCIFVVLIEKKNEVKTGHTDTQHELFINALMFEAINWFVWVVNSRFCKTKYII